jgi:predicted Co/Zn/Cd cation transporter (cation efflux family)
MKTAVEKIIEEIDNEVDFLKTHQYVTEVRGRMIGLAFAKRVALELKEMEQEQQIEFACQVYDLNHGKDKSFRRAAEDYYNETFKQQ